jgi:hypothetical protein
MAVRFEALPPGKFLELNSVRGYVNPRTTVRLEGLGQLKKKLNPRLSGSKHRSHKLVVYVKVVQKSFKVLR